MLKLLTHFRRRSNRTPNHNLNPDYSHLQHEEDEDNNADDDDDVGELQTASSSAKTVHVGGDEDEDDDVRDEIEVETVSASERRRDDDDRDDRSCGKEFEVASSSERMTGDDEVRREQEVEAVDEEAEAEAVLSGEKKIGGDDAEKALAVTRDVEKKRMETPPVDDCCPICFGNFVVPCRGPCGHWYCGGCILQYWNYTAALQPCNCPMCSGKITKLTPEASLYQQHEAEVIEVLRNVQKYNRLFVGGLYGLILKVFELPLYIKRMFIEMMNPDRPGAHLNKLRLFAMFLGCLYSISPFDFLRIGRQNVVDLFDYLAIAISLILYGFGIYIRRRRFREVREMAAIQL